LSLSVLATKLLKKISCANIGREHFIQHFHKRLLINLGIVFFWGFLFDVHYQKLWVRIVGFGVWLSGFTLIIQQK
jgi:hypothetical protein